MYKTYKNKKQKTNKNKNKIFKKILGLKIKHMSNFPGQKTLF